MEQRIYLNEEWQFTESFTEELTSVHLPKSVEENIVLQNIRIPHTCKETPFHYFDESVYQMISGYRRTLFAPAKWQGKRVLLTFEGVAHSCEVFCNGIRIGEHHCGYTAFTVDLSTVLKYDAENILAVKVDSRESLNIPPFGFVIDYMTYGGIYRDVYLEIKNPLHVEDVYAHTLIENPTTPSCTANLTAETTLHIQDFPGIIQDKCKYLLKHTLYQKSRDNNNSYVAEVTKDITSDMLSLKEQATLTIMNEIMVKAPALWDVDAPNLYLLQTELIFKQENTEEQTDTIFTTFGFRDAVFKKDGFYLNGRKLKIRGLNRHQCYPYVGYAMPQSMQELDADILKNELGLNAVRTSHYPQSHYFLSRCDEIGLLVFTEIPGWQHIGDEAWKQQAIRNVEEMVLQYRNHTSIILWGVRINESKDDDDFYKRTNEVAHRLDPHRQTGGVRAHKQSSLLEDVYTYNDFVHDGSTRGCDTKKTVTSNMEKPYLVSEYNGHMYPTKDFDNEERRAEHAIRHANVLNAICGEDNIAGSFGWCMFDYNTHKDFGSGDRICYHGVMDMFRNPKLAAYVYACEQEDKPVLEISSSMDIGEHPGCNRGTIWIFTNADSVRMYKNDRFIKEYKPSESPYKNLKHGPVMIDDFIGDALEKNERFKPKHAKQMAKAMNIVARGSLSHIPLNVIPTALKLALIYRMNYAEVADIYTRYIGDWGGTSTTYRFEAIKDGTIVKTIVKEPVKKIHLDVKVDHTLLVEKNSYDTALIRLTAKDEHDNILNFYQEPVSLSAIGDIEIVGPEIISLYGGMGGTYVRSKGVNGKGTLVIKANGMEEQQITFTIENKSKKDR